MKDTQKIYKLLITIILLLGISACGGSSTAEPTPPIPPPILSTDATLSALTLSAGDIAPAFASSTTGYTLTTSNDSTTVTPTVNDVNATVTVNGTAVVSGAASASIPLAVGDTTVSIVVTAEDGSTTQTYTVTITRPSAVSTDATLSALTLSAGDIAPAFASGTMSYTLTTPNDSTTVTPTVNDANATVTVNGTAVVSGAASASIPLAVGDTTVSIAVTAEDGSTTQTYTVTITRPPAVSTDAALSALTLSAGDIAPVFASGTISYTLTTSSDTTTVTPTVNDANATVTVDSTAVASGAASSSIALAVGDTTINIVVTAEDGTSTTTYTVTVTRESAVSNNADLFNLSLSVGSLSPAFDSATLDYTASVSFTTLSINVTPTLSDNSASVTVNGALVNSNTASAAINLDEGENTITLVVLAEDSTTTQTYTVVVTRQAAAEFAQQAYIKASNTGVGDRFGFSVALDGDTLAVGATGEDTISGAVYVFTRSGSVWSQQAYIKASNRGGNDEFGGRVALEGDTLVVGAFFESSNATGVDGDESNNSAEDSGAVYVFTRSGSTWTQQAYIKASNTDAGDRFGGSVALAGDTLAVGAFGEASIATGVDGDESNNDVSFTGAVYVFTRNGIVWTQQAYIKASNTGADSFGTSVALEGDTLAVGAVSESSNATGIGGDENNNDAFASGAVYVFTRSGSSWTQQAYIKASNTDAFDRFGFSVALDGDTLAVGVSGEDSNATGVDGDENNNSGRDSGAVYVFTRSGGSWTQQAYIKASNAEFDDFFGGSVALEGDTLAVGATSEDSNATSIGGNENDNSASRAGAVYVFTRSGGSWTQQAYIKASNTDAQDIFGRSVALDGDTLAVGAEEGSNATGIDGDQGDNSGNLSGAVYVFEIPIP